MSGVYRFDDIYNADERVDTGIQRKIRRGLYPGGKFEAVTADLQHDQ